MNTFLIILMFLVEVGFCLALLIWNAAFLGFAGDGHRGESLSMLGIVVSATSHIVALTPLLVTSWLIYRKFISAKPEPSVAYWTPVVMILGAAAVCYGLILVFNAVAYTPKT